MNKVSIACCAVLLAATTGCASAPPKVLVGHNFAGDEKSVKVMLQDSGETNKASGARMFNVFVRMCDVGTSAEAACKDSQVLDGVVPGSVY